MSYSSRIEQIQEQKRRLRDRIARIDTNPTREEQQSNSEQTYEQRMKQLMEKKKKLEQQKEKHYNYMKMQDEYINRRKNIERQKQIEQLQNQKRLIQLQVGMKKAVLEGVREKVKGINSQQLMMRAMLRDGQQTEVAKPYTSKGNIRRDFDKYLQTTEGRKQKQCWDIYQLNEKRLEIFEKKEEAVMREILLKQIVAKDDEYEILELDVMKMNRIQLEEQFQKRGIYLEDYLNPVPKQRIIEAIPEIEQNSKMRIKDFQEQKRIQREEQRAVQNYKLQLRQQLAQHKNQQAVRVVKSVVVKAIDDIINGYERRVNRNSLEQIHFLKGELDKQYQKVLIQDEDDKLSKDITTKILQQIHDQFLMEAAEQVGKLHDFSHAKTEDCFMWMFSPDTNITKKLQDLNNIPFQLNFEPTDEYQREQQEQMIKKEKQEKKYDDLDKNIFDVDKLTNQLINDLDLLQAENRYFRKVTAKHKNQFQGPDKNFHICYDRELYAITNECVSSVKTKKKYVNLNLDSRLPLLHRIKFHNIWIIHDPFKITIFSPWGKETFQNQIGQRMSNSCGKISFVGLFPIFTVLGGICSLMVGFENGQVLKLNLNFNRLSHKQMGYCYYQPLLPSIKTGQDPPFPLDKKNVIPSSTEISSRQKGQQMHQHRQFFDHHTHSIITICFYRSNHFVTVDKRLKCALWKYQEKQGPQCYEPLYEFQFVPSYQIFREAENPQYRVIYPGEKLSKSGGELYQEWFGNESNMRQQIYNNPKKQTAFYKAPDWNPELQQLPVWKFTYENKKVVKIHESLYNGLDGLMQGKKAKVWKKYLLILCERQHQIRNDLKTMKVYGWDIQEKKMIPVAIQFDLFASQTSGQFQVLDTMLNGVAMNLMIIVSSGRILIFSMTSGQMLRNFSEAEYLENPKYSSYFFNEIVCSRAYLAAATKNSTVQISFLDQNTSEQQKKLNQIINQTRKKHINIL